MNNMYPELPLQEREISESVQVCMYGLKSVWNAPIIGHPLEGPRAREKRGDFVKSDPVKVLFFSPSLMGAQSAQSYDDPAHVIRRST